MTDEWHHTDGKWKHICKKRGRVILTREQMGVYLILNSMIVERSLTGKWQVDEPPGCPWCGHFPVELIEPIRTARSRRPKPLSEME